MMFQIFLNGFFGDGVDHAEGFRSVRTAIVDDTDNLRIHRLDGVQGGKCIRFQRRGVFLLERGIEVKAVIAQFPHVCN